MHNAQVGNVDFQKASSFEIDGLDGAQVYCKVAGDGSFYVDAFIKGKGAQISVEIPSITEEATKTNPVTGTVRYLSSTTVKAYTSPSSDPCKFFLINDKQQINQGSLFISFQCPSLDNGETSPPSECATGEGRLALQNCDQE